MAIELVQFPVDPTTPLEAIPLDEGVYGYVVPAFARHALDDVIDDDFYTALHGIADRLTPTLRQQFLQAVRQLRADIDRQALVEAAQAGRLDEALAAIPTDGFASVFEAVQETLQRATVLGVQAAAEDLAIALEIGLEFGATNPRALAYAQTQSARLVREVTETTREAIRRWLTRAIADELSPGRLTERLADVVGLTARQALALEHFREELLADGASAAQRDALVQRYAQALRRQRAQTIARTELLASANAGQQALWLDAREQGLLDTHTVRREWIATPDDAVDTACLLLDGQRVGLDEPFPGGIMHPPLHPNCRCTLGLVIES